MQAVRRWQSWRLASHCGCDLQAAAQITYIPGSPAVYNMLASCRKAGCNQYLSCDSGCTDASLNLWNVDDGSGRQQIQVHAFGRPVCGKALRDASLQIDEVHSMRHAAHVAFTLKVAGGR